MDNTTEQLDKSLNAFFEHPEMRVAALKGKWGIGKTYFWNEYIAEYIESADCKYQAYSYVSLFNNKDINEIKQQVLYSVKPIKIEIEKSIPHKCWHQITNFMNPQFNKIKSLANHAAKLPHIEKYGHLILGLGYLLQQKVNNYIICIDDIERKHKSITMDALLGFIDDLAQHKSCKVVLILNEDGITDGNLKTLTKYREKVIDIEVNYLPTFKDSLEIAVRNKADYFDELLNIITILEITNIRVLRKINWTIQKVLKEFKQFPDSAQSQLISQIALLCWSYYKAEGCLLPFEVIEKNICDVNLHGISLNNNDSKKLTNAKYHEIVVEKLHIHPEPYSKDLIHLLKNGAIDHDSLKSSMDTIVEEIEKQKAEQILWQIWDDMYSGTFKDNADDIINEFEKVLDKEKLGKITLTNFSQIINFIEKFTKKDTYDKKIDNYIDRYIEYNKHYFSKEIYIDFPHDINKTLKRNIVGCMSQNYKQLSIDDVAERLVSNVDSWNPRDSKVLSEQSPENYYNWIKSEPDNIVVKVRKLLGFGNISGGQEKEYRKIASSVKEALVRIAKESELNKMRIENIYNIKK